MSRLLKSKSKVSETLLRELLFADDAALTSHSVADLQRLIDRFNHACIEFGLTISLKKTVVMAQDANEVPSFKINDECGRTGLSRIGLFSHKRAKHNPAGFAGQ